MIKLETLTHKYTFLMIIAVTSTIVLVSILGVLHLTLKDHYELLLIGYICLSIDSIVNCNCVYYSMGYTNQTYNKICKKYEISCLNCFRLKGITFSNGNNTSDTDHDNYNL
mmetsp:Transcript_36985/g.45701  ORF Transcript_36985/g.45701 Transcript_36985/m.45701 type:complete len:111 (+) Transcript_36985:2-334(+)